MRDSWITRHVERSKKTHVSRTHVTDTECGIPCHNWVRPNEDAVPRTLASLLAQVTCTRCVQEIIATEIPS